MSLHADNLAEQFSALERNKKISWFTTIGQDQLDEAALSKLVEARESDRVQAESLRASEDASRRIGTTFPHMAPLDEKLRNIIHSSSSNTSNKEKEEEQDDNDKETEADLLSTYPPHAKSSYDPLHPEASAFRWTPAASDFFPNTKTMIESRKGALQQFKQLCYFTLLRKRVESRLETLQRERGLQLQQLQKQQQQQGSATVNKPPLSSATIPNKTSTTEKQKSNIQQKNSKFIILGDCYDPLPNPSVTAPFALSKELKVQVEKKLMEEAARAEEASLGVLGINNNSSSSGDGQQQQQAATGGKGKKDGPGTKKTSSSPSGRTQSSGGDNNNSKGKTGSKAAKSAHFQQDDSGTTKDSSRGGRATSARSSGNNNMKSRRVPTFTVSSNLELLQPLHIADLETHPELTTREPFEFKSQRFPRLPFPKHDFIVAGPKNTPLNFPAGTNEVSEVPITNPAKIVLDALANNGQLPKSASTKAGLDLLNASTTMFGGGGTKSARGGNQSQQQRSNSAGRTRKSHPHHQSSENTSSRPTSAAPFGASRANYKPHALNDPSLTARNIPSSFIPPQVSLETFDTPSVIVFNKFRPAMQLQNGASVLSGMRDFPAGYFTTKNVVATPLEAARPSPVPPRHKQLDVAAMKTFYATLPKTLMKADPLDDLSDDEDHDLVDHEMGDDQAKNNMKSASAIDDDADDDTFIPEIMKQKRAEQLQQQEASPLAGCNQATFLSTPPLSLDDALKLLRVPPVIQNRDIDDRRRRAQQQQQNAAGAMDTKQGASRRPPSPSSNKRPNTPSNKKGQQQNVVSDNDDDSSNRISSPNKKKVTTAKERLEWTKQPVHSEDVHETNSRVEDVLKTSTDSSAKRKNLVPSFLKHLA